MGMLELLGLMRKFQNKRGDGGARLTRGERDTLKREANYDVFLSGEVSQFLALRSVKARRAYFNELRKGAEPVGYPKESSDSFRDDTPGVYTWQDIQDGYVQGEFATCTVLAAAPYKVRYRDNENNTRTFEFHDRLTGQPEYVTVSNRLSYSGAPEEWGSLEKAYAVYQERNGTGDWSTVSKGNAVGDVLIAYTGKPTAIKFGVPTVDEAVDFTRNGKAVILVSKMEGSDALLPNHAYRLMSATPDGVFNVLNPLGYDGSRVVDYTINGTNLNDGLLTFNQQQLKENFRYYGAET